LLFLALSCSPWLAHSSFIPPTHVTGALAHAVTCISFFFSLFLSHPHTHVVTGALAHAVAFTILLLSHKSRGNHLVGAVSLRYLVDFQNLHLFSQILFPNNSYGCVCGVVAVSCL
jgi:hypothetical protein